MEINSDSESTSSSEYAYVASGKKRFKSVLEIYYIRTWNFAQRNFASTGALAFSSAISS